MECSICAEKFINPKEYSKEQFVELMNENIDKKKGLESDKYMRFHSLVLTKDNPFKCNTPNCESVYCLQCYTKIKQRDDHDKWGYDKKDTFQCAYCRNIDYKDYMKNNVLDDMMLKVLGPKEFALWVFDSHY